MRDDFDMADLLGLRLRSVFIWAHGESAFFPIQFKSLVLAHDIRNGHTYKSLKFSLMDSHDESDSSVSG